MAELSRGQSLIELIIAVAIGAVIILAGVSAVSVSLRLASQDPVWQSGNFLAQQVLDNITVKTEGDWPAIAAAKEDTAYYLKTTASGFDLIEGSEIKTVDGTEYSRELRLFAVKRNNNGEIDPNGSDDPSTKKTMVKIQWSYHNQPAELLVERYLTRTRNLVLAQSDWFGGPTCPTKDPVVESAVHTKFCEEDTKIDYQGSPGAIKIKGY